MADSPSFLDAYHRVADDGSVRISAQQASRFAKDVAGDFNPLHDVGRRRFCVPGDLLCGLALEWYGLSERMTFRFRGMVDADEPVHFPGGNGRELRITDARGGTFVEVEREGEATHDHDLIERFLREYVAFSGKTFPHYMIPVLRDKGVMFHPDRPMVIYDSMGFELRSFELAQPSLWLDDIDLEIGGRRGDTVLRFDIEEGGTAVGAGWKKLVISGLREYDAEAMDDFLVKFNQGKADYEAARDAGDSEH